MKLAHLTDRTAVLFIGIAVGAAISQAFLNGGSVMASPPVAATAVAAGPAAGPVGASPETRRDCASQLVVTPELTAAIRRGETIDVGVFGDSFGEGLFAAVHNELRHEDRVEVYDFAKNSTGFTRYRSLNLLDDIRAKIDRQPVDIAIISFGANDTQGIWEGGNGSAYMSDPWKSRVGEKIDAVIELLRGRGVSIVWVGLPKMRESNFEREIGQMNAFNSELMCSLNVPFIDTVPASLGADGYYAARLPIGPRGDPVKVREGDGVHMTMTGYGLIVRDLIADIAALAPDAAPAASPAAPAQPAASRPTAR